MQAPSAQVWMAGVQQREHSTSQIKVGHTLSQSEGWGKRRTSPLTGGGIVPNHCQQE